MKNKESDVKKIAETEQPVIASPIVINDLDFTEFFNLIRERDEHADILNKVAGQIERLKKDIEVLYSWEKTKSTQIEAKRLEIVKRHQIDNSREWTIEYNTKTVIYK